MREWWTEEWYTKALELFPEERAAIEETVNTPMGLWITLSGAFQSAYACVPPDEDMIQRIYHFAHWCLRQEQERRAQWDLPTCVIVGLYKHIPTIAAARKDMPRWFTRAEVVVMHQTFKYHLTDAEFEELLTLFPPASRSQEARHKAQRKSK